MPDINKRIIFPNDEGGVSIIVPAQECSLTLEQIAAQNIPIGKPYKIIDVSDMPSDRTFRNAWEQNHDVVTINFAKAKEITKTRLREERAPLLAAQDVAFQRALETGSDTKAIVTEKQRLRDVTKLVDGCTNPDQLLSIKC